MIIDLSVLTYQRTGVQATSSSSRSIHLSSVCISLYRRRPFITGSWTFHAGGDKAAKKDPDPVKLHRSHRSVQQSSTGRTFMSVRKSRFGIYRVFKWKYMSYPSSFRRYNEFTVSITFTKDAKKRPSCIWRQAWHACLVIHLVTLSIVPGVSRICRKPRSILFRGVSARSIDVAYTIDFQCPQKWKSNGFKSGERAGHATRISTINPFICKVSI